MMGIHKDAISDRGQADFDVGGRNDSKVRTRSIHVYAATEKEHQI